MDSFGGLCFISLCVPHPHLGLPSMACDSRLFRELCGIYSGSLWKGQEGQRSKAVMKHHLYFVFTSLSPKRKENVSLPCHITLCGFTSLPCQCSYVSHIPLLSPVLTLICYLSSPGFIPSENGCVPFLLYFLQVSETGALLKTKQTKN